MPKKTRREKIIADYRKKLLFIHEAPHPQPVPGSYQLAAHHVIKQDPTLALDTRELSAIKRDIVKTVLLATIAIAAEVALHWFWKKPA